MARGRSPAETMLRDVIARGVTPPLKAAGFRKDGMNYRRRLGEAVQVVNIQSSHGSTWAAKAFYINVGIAFDAICRLAGVPILERPKEYECDDRGTRDRLEAMIPGCPDSWRVGEGGDADAVAHALRGAMERLAAGLDRIDGIASYRDHPWFDRFRPRRENAQVFYLLGDLGGAWREIRDLNELLSDRPNAPTAAWWVERLKLVELGSRLGGRVD